MPLNFSNLGREFSQLIGRAAPVLLGLGVVVPGRGMLEVYRAKKGGVVTVRFEAPDDRMPEGGTVPIAVDEEDGARRLGGRVDRQEQQEQHGQKETTSEFNLRSSLRSVSSPPLVFSWCQYFVLLLHFFPPFFHCA